MSAWTFGDVALLRPAWLLLIPLALFLAARPPPRDHGWRAVLSPALQRYFGLVGERRGFDARWFAVALVALALAGPATRDSTAASWRHGSAWLALVDVSRSMTLTDTAPSRLAGARDTVRALSDAAGARALALAVFAGDAFLLSPPAFDRRQLERYASRLEHGSVPLEGSNLARALALAGSVADDAGVRGARVFLLFDGGGTGGEAEAAARALAANGHRLDVLLFGLPHTAPASGAEPADPDVARQLAAAGGGSLVQADALGAVDLAALRLDDRSDDLEPFEALIWRDRSHWLLLVLLPWMAARVTRATALAGA